MTKNMPILGQSSEKANATKFVKSATIWKSIKSKALNSDQRIALLRQRAVGETLTSPTSDTSPPQAFCGAPERTVLLDKIRDVEDEEDMADILEIFFQKQTNSGGEIESIKYISRGKELLALFDVI